jgi:tetratricopeptide (TPR) repeat protein
MIRKCHQFVFLAFLASFLVVGCAKAGPELGCTKAQAQLDEARDALNSSDAGGPERFDSALAAFETVCDASTFEAGMKLVQAYAIKGDAPSIERSLVRIKPGSAGQSQQLEMKKLDFYASRGLFEQASKSLKQLRSIPADSTALDLAEAQMECRFGRCATKLEALQRLTAKYPSDAQLSGLLAFSLADRQEFQSAAPEFDRALKLDPSALDEVVALAAVVTYCNTGQKQKAESVYDVMRGDWGVFMGVEGATLEKMRMMIQAPSGKTFHFSKWPIDDSRK